MDRQERGSGELSAIQEIEKNHQIEVVSIIRLQDIIDFLQKTKSQTLQGHLDSVVAYRQQYGV